MKTRFSKLLQAPINVLTALAIAALVLLPLSTPFAPVIAAASAQVTHAVLCAPDVAGGVQGPRQVKNTSSTTGGTYSLNSGGCAVFVGSDVGYFLSQGYSYGPNTFTLQATGLSGGASGTAAVNTGFTLPAYGYIVSVVLCETAGNAVTGGLDIGDAGSITRFASAVTLGANACVTLVDTALTRIFVASGVPTSSTMQVAAHAAGSWNSASVNITLVYSFF